MTPPPAPVAPPGLPVSMPAPKWHDIKVRRVKKIERAVIAPVPPEEFGISRYARNIRDCQYCFHEVIKTEGDMIEQGYDPDQIKNVATYAALTNMEELARDTVEERQGAQGDGGLNRVNREIKITEHYIKLDYKGDGKVAMYRVTTAGDPTQVLRRKLDGEKQYTEEIVRHDGPPPFAAICPVPMPHRFFGRSIADLIIEIQKIKTAVLRGMLDNVYQRLNPRMEVPQAAIGPSTIDDILTARPMGVIRTAAAGQLQVIEAPDVGQGAFPMMQYLDAQREWKTGLSRQGQGVDPNALQNQVATIANQMMDASQSKIKLIARIFAEGGFKDLFSLLHWTIRKHGSQPQTIRLRGQWITIDPREWKARSHMSINVGLGNGDHAMQLAKLQVLIQGQTQAVPAGLVSKRNLFNSAKEMVRLVRPGADVNSFFVDPSMPPNPQDPSSAPLPPPQDPKQQAGQQAIIESQSKMQLAQLQAQHDAQLKQMQMALQDKQAQADIATQTAKAQSEAALAAQKAELDRANMALQAQIKQQQHDAEMAMREQEMRHRDLIHRMEHGSAILPEDITPHVNSIGDQLAAHTQNLAKTLTDHANAVHAIVSAPRKVVRDPRTNRVVGVEVIKHS